MDPQTPEIPSTPPVEPPKPKDGHWITILAMALFVLAALSITGFLYYQNQQLKQMLATYQSQPTSTPSAISDPTSGWETYTNDKLVVSFRYPGSEKLQIFPSTTNQYHISLNQSQYGPLYLELALLQNTELKDWFKKAYMSAQQDLVRPPDLQKGPSIAGYDSYKADFNQEGSGKITYIFIQRNEDLYQINLPTSNNEVQYQILSTLKFIEPASPIPTSKACTEEAKLCPDGSYVGRTGPNCEFAPCP